MEIINYKQEYEEAVVNLWNSTLVRDTITDYKFRKQALFDENFDSKLCYVALEEEMVVGFLLATKRKFPYQERGLEPERGWINVLFVHKDYQKKGIGSRLLDTAENDLKKLGCKRITLGAYSPNYFFPGIDNENYPEAKTFFEGKGYIPGEVNFSMKKDLHGYYLSNDTLEKYKSIQKKGFTIKSFNYSYALELLEFARDEFGGGWKRNVLISMQNDVAEENILIVTDNNNKICGFCMRMIDGNPMRFGPIGIEERVRNFGIGGILFDFMQADMARKGIYHLYFVTTDTPGRRFYERHGVEVFRTFIDYDKKMEGK